MKTKYLLEFIGIAVIGGLVVAMLAHFIGEVHGSVAAAVLLFGQVGLLQARVSSLQRELTSLREQRDGPDTKAAVVI